MKSRSTKSLIKKVQNDLVWPVLEKHHEVPVIRIVSYPHTKSHVIFKPDKLHDRSNDLDYLHELGHATFCEKVHPVFSANSQFAPHENKRQFLLIIPALNVACDWFIGHWQQELLPQEMQSLLKESLPLAEEIIAESSLPPLEVILDASLLIAQAIRYLKEPIECDGVLKSVVDAFLSVPPDQPSAENCSLLVNSLMATYTNHRARLVRDNDYYVWELFLPAGATETDNSASGKDS